MTAIVASRSKENLMSFDICAYFDPKYNSQ
jgi:hypothetical protein